MDATAGGRMDRRAARRRGAASAAGESSSRTCGRGRRSLRIADRRRRRVVQGGARRARRSRPGCTRCSRAWCPSGSCVPLGVDAARGWMLLPDGGPPLGETASGEARRRRAWRRALVRYGELQRELAPHVGRAARRGRRRHAAGGDAGPVRGGARGDRAPTGELWEPDRRAPAGRSPTGARELAESPLPASLDHNDLHPWNVLGGERFYDWGDSVVAHPFAVALVPLAMLRRPGAGARRLPARVRRPGRRSRPTLELACRVAHRSPAR